MEETRVDLEMIRSSSVADAGELAAPGERSLSYSHERRASPSPIVLERWSSVVRFL